MPRMTLKHDEFLSEYGGRLPAGAAIDLGDDEAGIATAKRWERIGMAVPSKESDRSAREMRLAELQAEMDRLRSEGDTYTRRIERGEAMGLRRMQRPGERPTAAALAGAELANGADDEEIVEHDDADADDTPKRGGRK